MLQLLLVIRWWRLFKKSNEKPNILSCIILKKTWSVISKLFLLNCIFHYISNWSKVLEFYLTSFFNMKSWRVKFRNFLGDFPVHYAALFINRTINNNYMTLLMALHHTRYGFWYFFRCFKSNTYSWYTSNFESANEKSILHQGSCISLDVVLVSNYHSCKEKTIKLLPYHSFYEGHIPLKITEPLFWQSASKKFKATRCPCSSIPLKNFKLHLSWSLQHSLLNMCGYYFFFVEYKLFK